MKYLITIIALLCSSLLLAQDVLMQTATVTQCGGVFYDSGGEFGPYGNDENFVLTICPESPGQKVQLDFTAFSTQLNADVMTIYNGDVVDAATAFGTSSGVASPGLVTATAGNTSGCITIEFVSNATGNTDGWAANISCLTPCQTITSQIDTFSPAPNGDGYIRVCPNEDITLTGSGNFSLDGAGATYEWDLGDGNTAAGETATFSYDTPGVYIVNLNIFDSNTTVIPEGCSNTNLINQVIQVATEPDFTGTEADGTILSNVELCFGESITIFGEVEAVEFINDCTPPASGTTVLPDQSGATYETSITVDCYESSQTLTDVNQIVEICINMEHSWSNDLEIDIISPNGQVAQLFDRGGGGTYFGGANNLDNQVPGVGVDYCFSLSGAVLLNQAPTVIAGSNPADDSWVSGTYLPVDDFTSLLGSPLNGDWTIRVIDNLQIDDGTIFSWVINFDPNLQPPELSFTPVLNSETWDADPSITSTNGNDITVQPATAGQHCYTYRVTDDFGCEYTEEVCIEVNPEIVTENPNNLFVCDTGVPPYIFDLSSNTAVVLASATNVADLVVTYHNSLVDADGDTAAIANINNYSGSDGEIIFIRVEYLETGCYEVLSFTLNVAGQPTINPVSDLELCDDDSNDGFEEFDLSTQTLTILGSQPAADFAVTYHLDFADADAGDNALPLNYTNIVNPQPIFVRVENSGDSSCYNASATALFNLVVNAKALATAPEDMIVCDDPSNDGIATFNLSSQEGVILGGQDPVTYLVTYHITQDDANTNTDALPSNYTNIVNPQPIFVRVEDPANPSCYATTSFDLIINALPTLTAVTPLQVCDDDTDGFVGFPLNTKAAEFLNGQIGIVVTFHETLVGAETATSEIFDGYINTTMTYQIVFVRLENTTTNCYNVNTLSLEVVENPIANITTPLEVCDDNADGFVSFVDLSIKDAEVIGSQSGMTVSYYLNQANAESESNPLPNNYTNTTADAQLISVRIENATTGCYATTTLQLIVNPKPTLIAVTDYELCDDTNAGDEEEQFNLTTKTPEILDGQVNVTVAYYENQADADLGLNAITGPYTNTSNPQPIVAVLTNTMTNCISTTTFNLVVNPLPALVDPTPLEVCDDGTPDGLTEMDLSLKNDQISDSNPNYSVNYYETFGDADSEMNVLPTLYTNTSNGQIIFARVEDINTGCYDITPLELIVQQAPIAFDPQPLRYCDPDSDGFGVFTLTDADNEITGGASGLSVTYHETPINADNGVNAIDTSVNYNNIVQNTQILYVRVESATITTDCATIVELELVVEPTPQIGATPPTALEICDDISADGIGQFDLASKESEILQNLADPMLYNVTFYLDEANADLATNPIGNTNNYTNSTAFNQIIWVRVEDDASGCYKLTTLELIVNALPVLVTPAPLEMCDVNNPGDEQEAFPLEAATEDILNGQTGITLTHYLTLADAENATNPIFSPYVNISNPQTIIVRASNNITGCFNTVTVTLRVNPIPSPEANPQAIEVCDDDNDGFAAFDLDQRTVAITNGELDVVITYHETQTDAEMGDNPILGLYTNIVANNQMIYVRSENTLTNCYSLTTNTMELIVHPAPEVPTVIEPYTICDDDDNGISQFDLTTMDEDIFNGQDESAITLTYHLNLADAETGNNPIINEGNYTNTANPQEIYVRLFNATTGCLDTGLFELVVELPPVAVQPTQLNACDDLGQVPGDEITVFDLTEKDTEITAGNASWSVAYYETNADAQAQMNAIPDPTQYTNTANAQTLFVVVTDTDTGCVDFVTLTIRVEPNPTPTLVVPNLELCDDINTGDGVEIFDLTENESLILNFEPNVSASYYEDADDANSATNAIPNPTEYTNIATPEQQIYVRVTNDLTGCYALVDFMIIVHPLPEVVAVTDFIQCELNTDGFDSFDLSTKDAEVLNGQDALQFVVSYHESLLDAEATMNGLVSPYTNTSNPQQIFVTITNTVTGCSISTQSFNIEVHEGARANPDPEVFEQCDDNMETDGNTTNDSVQFDLTTQDLQILDGQDDTNYIVTYYATEDDANQNVNPLPTLYENVVNPQIIYARVDNNTPDATTGNDTSICYAITALTLQVNPLPEFVFELSYILCINTNGSEVLDPLVLDTDLSVADYSFVWFYNTTEIASETGSSMMPTEGGTYSVLVTNLITGCENTSETAVMESERPMLVAELVTQAFSENHVIEALATGTGNNYEYSLDNGPWQDSGTFTNVSAGTHQVTARDKNGCGTASVDVFVIDYPRYFTPNGDGYNDTWNIPGIGSNAKIYIFDRFGKLLKQISPSGSGWNGTYNGNNMPTDGYWFTVEYDEQPNGERKEFKAHFTLKR